MMVLILIDMQASSCMDSMEVEGSIPFLLTSEENEITSEYE